MKTNKFFYLAAVAALSLTACSSDDTMMDQEQGAKVPVQLKAQILDASTRAATNLNEGSLASGNVGVFLSGDYTKKYTYTAGTGGTLTPSGDVAYYPTDGSAIDIVAVYPETSFSNAASTTEFTVAADQSTDGAYVASDLLWAKASGKKNTDGAVTMSFQHKMAKIIVDVTLGDGLSGAAIGNITLNNIKPSVDFTPSTGVVSEAKGTAGDIIIGGDNNAAVVPAQEIAANTQFLSIEVTGVGTAVYKFSSAKTLVAGNYYQLNITVNKAAVTNATTIDAWSGSGTTNISPTYPGVQVKTFTTAGGVKFRMIKVEPNDNPATGEPSEAYWVSETEVTNGLWKSIMGSKPTGTQKNDGDDYPVTQVSWTDICQNYVASAAAAYGGTKNQSTCFMYKLNNDSKIKSARGSKSFRLLSDAEWTFAANGGRMTHGYTYAGSNTLADVAWNNVSGSANSNSTTHIVGMLQGNELGLYDMSGNVWEWVNQTSLDSPLDPSTSNGVIRGGSWGTPDASSFGTTFRSTVNAPSFRANSFGFRLALPE